MATKQAYNVTLSKAGRDYGVWAGRTGGESTRDSSDYYPGGMQPARKLTGVPTTSDLVIRKLEDDLTDADIRELYKDLQSQTDYSAIVQRMTSPTKTSGAPRAYRCIVVGIAPPEVDAGSADGAEIQVTLSVYGLPTIAA